MSRELPSGFLPAGLESFLQKARAQGITPVLVGGAVRDLLAGATQVTDWDFELHGGDLRAWEQLLDSLRADHQLKTLGKGVVHAHHRASHTPIEFALPRSEHYPLRDTYAHGDVEPSAVPGLDFAAAALRRDFTLNAMGLALKADTVELWDPFGGEAHLRQRLLHPCDAAHFAKDPVRALRAHRFAIRDDLRFTPELTETLEHMDLSLLTSHYVGEEARKSRHPFRFWNAIQKLATLPVKFQGGVHAVDAMEAAYERALPAVGHSNALLAAVFAASEGWHLLQPLGGKGEKEASLWRDRRESARQLANMGPAEVLADPTAFRRMCQLVRGPGDWPKHDWVRWALEPLGLDWWSTRPWPEIDLREFSPSERHPRKVTAWLS